MNLKDNGYCKTKKQSQSMPNNLFRYRQQANISQDKLAEAVDCSRRTIGNIENGEAKIDVTLEPYEVVMIRIA